MSTTLDQIARQIRAGELESAREKLRTAQATQDNPGRVQFLEGYLAETQYDRVGAARAYEAALAHASDDPEVCFRAALLAERSGDDEAAIRWYEQCVARGRAHVNALLNLALLYEEYNRFSEAEACLQSILAEHPNHQRARRLLASAQCSQTMFYDERSQRNHEQRSAILDAPITDFELSVRSRNCLRQMNIRTIGDLLRTTEGELLSYKNFGETSLNEIKALLALQGLELGQALQTPAPPPPPPPPPRSVSLRGDVAALTHRSVSDLELSVRSRKCLQRLGISTLGELTQYSEPELMANKNFGQTSLNEIKRQLAQYGLSLRQ